MIVAGALNFGGPGTLPQGRFDTSYVFIDTFSRASGRHSMKFGGEYRHFINENFAEGTGVFNFPSVEAFLAGTANAFNITLGERRSVIDQRARGPVRPGPDRRPRPAHAGARDCATSGTSRPPSGMTGSSSSTRRARRSCASASTSTRSIQQNNRNFEPRVGLAWSLSPTVERCYARPMARAVDEPCTTAVRDTAGNPPFAAPLTAAGSIPLVSAIDATRPAGLAPATVDPRFRNASMQSWNVNVQRQLARELAVTVGYLGLPRHEPSDLAQHQSARRRRPAVRRRVGLQPDTSWHSRSATSPRWRAAAFRATTLPGSPSPNACRAVCSSTPRTPGRSRSTPTRSIPPALPSRTATTFPTSTGLSDFDARHRFVLSATYALPFTGHVLTRGWQLATVVQSQSGNPVNIVTSNSSLNGVPNSVRPDVTGPIRIIGSVDRWFDPSVFVAADHFGNLGRNVVIGPGFNNTDLSLIKNARPGARLGLQFRVDVFDLFNHPNFGPPGNIVGSPTFGKITRTRLPTGEAGSSRQIQLAVRLSF